MMKSISAFLSLLFPLLASAAQVDQRVAFELFQRDVHPFLRKNCSECHGEGALGWSGPPHSYADPKIAFGAFIKRINFDNPEQSMMFRQARNQHFCKEFDSCRDVERRSTEAMAKVMQYISNVKASSAIDGGGTQSAEISKIENRLSHREYEKTIPWRSQAFKLQDLSVEKTEGKSGYIATTAVLPVVDTVTLNVTYARVRENMYVITKISAQAKKGIYAFQDLKVFINGQQINNLSGLDNLDRAIYFTNPFKEQLEYLLTLSKPVLLAKAGDSVEISFGNLQELDRYPSLVCDRKKDEWDEFSRQFSPMRPSSTFSFFYQDTELAKCYRIESLLDFRNPRRSPLLNGSIGYNQSAQLIELLTKWME